MPDNDINYGALVLGYFLEIELFLILTILEWEYQGMQPEAQRFSKHISGPEYLLAAESTATYHLLYLSLCHE